MKKSDGMTLLVEEFRGVSKGDILSTDHLTKLTGWTEEEVDSSMAVVYHILLTYFRDVQIKPDGYYMAEDHLCPACGLGIFHKAAPIDYLCSSCGSDCSDLVVDRLAQHEEADQARAKYERGPTDAWDS
jgi:hypothetical protein